MCIPLIGMEQFHGMSDGNINISDVIEVIETTDPGFAESSGREDHPLVEMNARRLLPYIEIIEQPASKALRFRYECEGRSAGSIPGANSTPENKTFPSIRIVGYKGRAIVVVSCVTKEEPYRPHPHNLVGKEACKRGVCTVEVSSENMTVTFANLGIQCVKKKDIEEALRIREEIRVDPFRTGFDHKRQPSNIDLNAVRLCFQVFIEGSEKAKFNLPLKPVVSDIIYDKKAMSDLVICKLSHCSASVAGGMEMILLCEKVAKEDIQVRFFEEKDGKLCWEGLGDFQPAHVHKQTAIAFRTPSYNNRIQVDQPVQVYIQLRRPSDGTTSEPLPFQMLPLGADDPDSLRRKRQKFNNSPNALILRHVQAEAEKHAAMLNQPITYNFNIIKSEPTERIPPFGGPVASGASFPMYSMGTTSPQPQSTMQALRPQVSPGRTPSPMDYKDYSPYNSPVVQSQLSPQYQSTNNRAVQPPSAGIHVQQQFPYVHNALQPQEELMLAGGVEATDVTSLLDMDNQQYNFDSSLNPLDSAELAAFGTALSNNLSSGLSISDSNRPEASRGGNPEVVNIEESSNMTDSFTRITNNTIQELCTLNNMFKPTRQIDN
ncbi:proto-oncogene c-Rel isoform X3 [Hylaeus anthracinus]|uniref:proto-oncogene c-Rel-like isoform X3 n=1 Tax=Hylaeus volcanicus TaxID=313075 RepID=UPI0023B7D1EF|nr:proto-oncogene c-Rel-like isoform X3 [Hylaeus volcanicus]XP_054002896.1 proto-oncogene c-Rel isoform X3 [Hylaeus anthracinus]